jgi:hypothetical protein
MSTERTTVNEAEDLIAALLHEIDETKRELARVRAERDRLFTWAWDFDRDFANSAASELEMMLSPNEDILDSYDDGDRIRAEAAAALAAHDRRANGD